MTKNAKPKINAETGRVALTKNLRICVPLAVPNTVRENLNTILTWAIGCDLLSHVTPQEQSSTAKTAKTPPAPQSRCCDDRARQSLAREADRRGGCGGRSKI